MCIALLLASCTDPGGEDDDSSSSPPVNEVPVVTITSPTSGAVFAEGEAVLLSGSATDPEDGDVPDGVLSWYDADVGDLGAGPEISVTLLPGYHTVLLRAADEEGDLGTAAVAFSVGSAVAPETTLYTSLDGLPGDSVRSLSVHVYPTSTGGAVPILGAATSGGVALVDLVTRGITSLSPELGLASGDVASVGFDGDGILWVGYSPIDPLDTSQAQDLDRVSLLASDDGVSLLAISHYEVTGEIYAIVSTAVSPPTDTLEGGNLWLGSNEVLCVVDTSELTVYQHAHPTHPHGFARGVVVTPSGRIWVGDQYQLSQFSYEQPGNLFSGTWKAILNVFPDGEDTILAVALDSEEAVWVASGLWGLARVIKGDDVVPELENPEGSMGGDHYHTTNAAITLWSQGDGLPSPAATAVVVTPDDVIWVGTDTGVVYRFDPDSGVAVPLVTAPPLPSAYVRALIWEEEGPIPTLWVATDQGLAAVPDPRP